MDFIRNERFRTLLSTLKKLQRIYNDTDFSIKVGTTKTYISEIKNNRRKVTEQFVTFVANAFPEVNPEWIISGKGEMLNTAISDSIQSNEDTELSAKNSLQYYEEMDVTASNIEGLMDNELNAPSRLINIPGFEGCVGFNVRGDSMLPTMKHGDIVAIERNTVETIINGEMYFIITRDGQRMIKRLVYDRNAERITCFSDNPDQLRFAPFDLDGEMIVRVSRVRGCFSYKVVG